MSQSNKEQIYKVWVECGQVATETVRKLKELGFTAVTRQTLAKWVKENGWEDRAAKDAAAAEKLKTLSRHGQALVDLQAQKERYDAYFETMKKNKVDNQATFAYSGLIRMMEEIRQKTAEYKIEIMTEFFSTFADFMLNQDEKSKDLIDQYFEGFTEYLQDKYVG